MIVIPMAGLSSRFFNAGYVLPKYMLDAHGQTLFAHAVNSFSLYFDTHFFLFIVRDLYDTEYFVQKECNKLGIKNYQIIVLYNNTNGQADTVRLGLKAANILNQSITIFNIDTFRPGFIFPDFIENCDGYLEVFKGQGDNWSFVKAIDNSQRVIETAEKKPISNLCSTGLYYFKSSDNFMCAFEKESKKDSSELCNGEIYVAPMYNDLIKNNKDIRYHLIHDNEVIFCGVPEEYENFKK
jgi:hypothetical protein